MVTKDDDDDDDATDQIIAINQTSGSRWLMSGVLVKPVIVSP